MVGKTVIVKFGRTHKPRRCLESATAKQRIFNRYSTQSNRLGGLRFCDQTGDEIPQLVGVFKVGDPIIATDINIRTLDL
jgi:hypothetical protein